LYVDGGQEQKSDSCLGGEDSAQESQEYELEQFKQA
jgi:hypothetical protein